MTITAAFVRDTTPKRKLWKLSASVDGGEAGNTQYVVTSGIDNEWGVETYIFPSDEEGRITGWLEMPGSFQGDVDHERAIRGAGWEIVP